jgi:hypothetical protein
MTDTAQQRAFEGLSSHARFADLVALARDVAVRAADAHAVVWQPLASTLAGGGGGGDGGGGGGETAALEEADAATDFGNVRAVLEHGPKTADEQALLSALWAHAVAETRAHAASTGAEDALAERVVWLAAHSPFDATLLLDRALGDTADSFWQALAARLLALDAGDVPSTGRAEALAAAVALRSSSSAAAAREAARLATRVKDPAVADVLRREAEAPPAPELHGELAPAPRSAVATVLLALTGILFVSASIRALLRVALAYRRPADVTLTATSVRVRWQTRILGRTIRDHDVLLARQGLARAAREVQYPRAAFYAGLVALALGSLVGVRTFVDGVRAASPSLLFYGLLIVAVGAGLDFLLAAFGGGPGGKCSVVFVSRDGTALAVRDVDSADADRALGQLTRTAK